MTLPFQYHPMPGRRGHRPGPLFAVLDLDWIRGYDHIDCRLYRSISVRTILETIVSVPPQQEFDDAFWDLFYLHFTDDEIDKAFLVEAECQMIALIDEFYGEFERMMPNISGDYTFHRWLDRYSMLVVREDYAQRLPRGPRHV